MLIKILPGEYLWSENGLHVIDSSGFATIATEESEEERRPPAAPIEPIEQEIV